MPTAADIQAGRAAISVALDDAQVQPQLQDLSNRLKAASAGLSAAGLQAGMSQLDRDFKAGAITSVEYQTKLAALQREFLASAAQADRYSGEVAQLSLQLKKGVLTQDQYTAAVAQARARYVAAGSGAHDTAGKYDALAVSALGVGVNHLQAIPGVSGLSNVLSAGHPILIAVAAATAGVAAAYKLASAAADLYTRSVGEQLADVDKLNTKAQSLGTSVQDLRELHAAASQLGNVEADEFDRVLQKLSVNIAEAASGAKTAQGTFSDLGIDFNQLATSTPTEALMRVADGLAGVQNQTERARLATELFGRGGAQLLPMLQEGRTAIEGATAAYRQYAGTLTSAEVAMIAEQGDAWERVKLSLQGIAANAAADLAPVLLTCAERVSALLDPGTTTGQSLRMSLEVIPPILAKIVDLSDQVLGTFQGAQTTVMGLANTIVQAMAMLDRARAAATPGGKVNAELQFFAEDYQRQVLVGINEAGTRFSRGSRGAALAEMYATRAGYAAGLPPEGTAGGAGAAAAAGELDTARTGLTELERLRNDPRWRKPRAAESVAAQEKADAEELAQYNQTMSDEAERRRKATEDAKRRDREAEIEDAKELAEYSKLMSDEAERRRQAALASPEGQLQTRIDDLKAQKAAKEIDRKARAAVEGPELSAAGTFSGWRLGGQFGTAEQTAKAQLEETKRQHHTLQRMLEVLDRKDPVTFP